MTKSALLRRQENIDVVIEKKMPKNPFESCLEKQHKIVLLFSACLSDEAKYEKIIELGRQQPLLDDLHKVPENLVHGCQSQMYLYSRLADDKMVFEVSSDALISSGLAALLVQVYNDEAPEIVLQCPPNHLDELGILSSLTPNRANGLHSLYIRMKQDSLKLLVERDRGKHHEENFSSPML